MGPVAIVTDSAADLTPEQAERSGILVVPLTVSFGESSFLAGVDLSTQAFWDRMTAPDAPFPRTAAPAPGTFQIAFEHAFASGAESLVYVGIAATLSATVRSAQVAAGTMPGREIHIVDSRTASMGVGILALVAVELAAGGMDAARIAATVAARTGDLELYVALDTLEYLRKGGRISGAQAAVGNLLSVKPIITVRDGLVEQADRVRTRSRVRERLIELLTRREVERLGVLHAMTDGIETFRDELVARMPGGIQPDKVTIQPLGASIGPHVGPGAYGAVVLRRPSLGTTGPVSD